MNKEKGPLHHIVAVPTSRPIALDRFLRFHSEHLKATGFDPIRVSYIVLGGSNRKTNAKLAAIALRHNHSGPLLGRIQFYGTGWKTRLQKRMRKEKVPLKIGKYLFAPQLSSLRNLAFLAAHHWIKTNGIPPSQVLYHQMDDDVLPAYLLSSNPSKPTVLPWSWFSSAQTIFNKHPNAAVIFGRYLGNPDWGAATSLRLRMEKPPDFLKNKDAFESFLNNEDLALKYYTALEKGIDESQKKTWVHPLHPDEFSNAYPSPNPSVHGGVMTFRINRFGHTPPNPYRGDDLSHAKKLREQAPESALDCPNRIAVHEKHQKGRSMFIESVSDFHSCVVDELTNQRHLNEKELQKEARKALTKYATRILNTMPAYALMPIETQGVIEKWRKTKSPVLKKILHLQTALEKNFRSLYRFYRQKQAPSSSDVRKTVQEMKSFWKLDDLLTANMEKMTRAAGSTKNGGHRVTNRD